MEGFFFYRLPKSSDINGCKGAWHVLKNLKEFESGILVTSFLKDHIFNMTECTSVELSYLDGFSIQLNEESYYTSKDEYFKQVNAGIDFCDEVNGKVVLSRIKKVKLSSKFNFQKAFESLCQKYDNAFVSFLYIPNYGCWMGATPEKILVGAIPKFKLDSLAGSRSIENPFEWTFKERNEQKMVTEFIEENLLKANIEFLKSDTKTSRAGNVEHLLTEFVTVNCFHPMALLEKLHPTPAVSGIPQSEAIQFISKTEKHNRKLYAGIIGIVQEDAYNLFVNLRCGEIKNDAIDLFVGGGLTKDSVGEVEWNETEFKSQTLLSVIEKM